MWHEPLVNDRKTKTKWRYLVGLLAVRVDILFADPYSRRVNVWAARFPKHFKLWVHNSRKILPTLAENKHLPTLAENKHVRYHSWAPSLSILEAAS